MGDENGTVTGRLVEPLNKRELEILHLLVEGMSNREIADALFLALSTVKWYLKHVYSKLDVSSRAQAILRAQELGLVGAASEHVPALPNHNLPAQMTSFVGREQELDALARLLADTHVRLLTILAPGGMGKTRLALEAARQQLGHFPNSVYLVELAPITSSDFIASAIADGIGFQFYPGGEQRQQLLDYLREKHLLLVLDNFEHLLDGATLVSEILTNAPGVKALATSRERLNLSGETVYTLSGMEFPEQRQTEHVLDYNAVQLFVQCARRAQPDFVINGDGAVVRICQLVQGMPLALELAAAWVGTLSPDVIAEEITRSLDFLRTEMRDVPERLRSVRAVFEAAWGRLSEDEQAAFRRLAVFRRGCTHEAAQTVTGADAATFTGLVNKALLWRNVSSGRYEIHELLRQYAEQELAATEEADALRDAHCTYYADFMYEREDDLLWQGLKADLELVDAEIDNVRSAFAWAAARDKLHEITQCAESLYGFYQVRGLNHEGKDTYQRAATRLRGTFDGSEEHQRVLGLCVTLQGCCLRRIARFTEAKQCLNESLALLRPLPAGRELVRTLNALGLIATEATEAKQWFEEALAIAKDNDLKGWIFAVTNNLIAAVMRQGDYSAAQQAAHEALAMSQNLDHAYGEVRSLQLLSELALYQGDYAAAKQFGEAWLVATRAIGFHFWLPEPYRILGHIACAEGDFEKAEQHYRESAAMGKEWSQRPDVLLALGGLGSVARQQNCYTEAWDYFRQALEVADDMRVTRWSLWPFSSLVELLADEGDVELAVEVSALVLGHPASEQPVKDRVLKTFRVLEVEMPAEVFAAAVERGKARDVEATVRELLEEAKNRERRRP